MTIANPTRTNDILARARQSVDQALDGLRMSAGTVDQDGCLSPDHLTLMEGTLEDLEGSLNQIIQAGLDNETHHELTRLLMGKLEPYLDKSPTAHSLMSRGEVPITHGNTHAALTGEPPTHGMGAAIEGWVRNLPSMRAWTDIPAACIQAAARNRAGLPRGTTLLLGADHPGVSAHIPLLKEHGKLVPVAWHPGATQPPLPEPPSLVVIVGILESMPSRSAVTMLSAVRQAMHGAGRIVASALVPSPDAALVDMVLGWPTIRRTPAQLLDLFLLAGLSIVGDTPSPFPGLVLIAEDRDRTTQPSAEY